MEFVRLARRGILLRHVKPSSCSGECGRLKRKMCASSATDAQAATRRRMSLRICAPSGAKPIPRTRGRILPSEGRAQKGVGDEQSNCEEYEQKPNSGSAFARYCIQLQTVRPVFAAVVLPTILLLNLGFQKLDATQQPEGTARCSSDPQSDTATGNSHPLVQRTNFQQQVDLGFRRRVQTFRNLVYFVASRTYFLGIFLGCYRSYEFSPAFLVSQCTKPTACFSNGLTNGRNISQQFSRVPAHFLDKHQKARIQSFVPGSISLLELDYMLL
jgi:hypothetical protein